MQSERLEVETIEVHSGKVHIELKLRDCMGHNMVLSQDFSTCVSI